MNTFDFNTKVTSKVLLLLLRSTLCFSLLFFSSHLAAFMRLSPSRLFCSVDYAITLIAVHNTCFGESLKFKYLCIKYKNLTQFIRSYLLYTEMFTPIP